MFSQDARKTLTLKLLSEALSLFDQGLEVLEEKDPQVQRSDEVAQCIRGAISHYTDIYMKQNL